MELVLEPPVLGLVDVDQPPVVLLLVQLPQYFHMGLHVQVAFHLLQVLVVFPFLVFELLHYLLVFLFSLVLLFVSVLLAFQLHCFYLLMFLVTHFVDILISFLDLEFVHFLFHL